MVGPLDLLIPMPKPRPSPVVVRRIGSAGRLGGVSNLKFVLGDKCTSSSCALGPGERGGPL